MTTTIAITTAAAVVAVAVIAETTEAGMEIRRATQRRLVKVGDIEKMIAAIAVEVVETTTTIATEEVTTVAVTPVAEIEVRVRVGMVIRRDIRKQPVKVGETEMTTVEVAVATVVVETTTTMIVAEEATTDVAAVEIEAKVRVGTAIRKDIPKPHARVGDIEMTMAEIVVGIAAETTTTIADEATTDAAAVVAEVKVVGSEIPKDTRRLLVKVGDTVTTTVETVVAAAETNSHLFRCPIIHLVIGQRHVCLRRFCESGKGGACWVGIPSAMSPKGSLFSEHRCVSGRLVEGLLVYDRFGDHRELLICF